MVIQVYEITMFGIMEISVTVIRVYKITVSSVTSVYMKYNVQCTGVSSVLDDTCTGNIKVRVMVIQAH